MPQDGKAINSAVQKPKILHSTFNYSRRFACTPRFGVNTPIVALELVPDDGPIEISPNVNTRSLSLKAPMVGDISRHVAFWQVPLQAILPFNWEKIVKNPTRGTDVSALEAEGVVPASEVNTVILNPAYKIYSALVSDFTSLQSSYPSWHDITASQMPAFLSEVFSFVLKYENFLSEGSLLAYMGVHYSSLVHFDNAGDDVLNMSFDSFCQYLLSDIAKIEFSMQTSSGNLVRLPSGKGVKHVREALDLLRSHEGPWVFSSFATGTGSSLSVYLDDISISNNYEYTDSQPLNYGRLCAYQIVCAHYYTNDQIDYIYSADLYRQFFGSLFVADLGTDTFVFNGVSTQYDFLSGHYMTQIFHVFLGIGLSSFLSSFSYSIVAISAVFGWNYSLRFKDYFVGARPHNLAVGDTTIRVDNNTVDVVDVSKSIVRQRFLNAVARVGNKIEDYSEKILGKRVEYDWHNPKYLFSFDTSMFTQEVENTAEAQLSDPNSITSRLRGNSGNHSFTISVDRHSFVIGIEDFDFARFYHTTQERNTMAVDRFDMFVPELQFVGDQELRRSELLAGASTSNGDVFGYQLRDMQFKQSFDTCAGGFSENLPGWLFKFNPLEFIRNNNADQIVINPDFIRSKPTELDDFYISLTGLTLAGYFHFIDVWNIGIRARRPMAYAPQIL